MTFFGEDNDKIYFVQLGPGLSSNPNLKDWTKDEH